MFNNNLVKFFVILTILYLVYKHFYKNIKEGYQVLMPGDGHYGDWSGWRYCPPGHFVSGVNVRIEGMQNNRDDTSMNGIRLLCTSIN